MFGPLSVTLVDQILHDSSQRASDGPPSWEKSVWLKAHHRLHMAIISR